MKIFRTILSLWAVAIALAACTAVETDRPEMDIIRFQVARYGVQTPATKAPDDYKTNYASVPFGAYAWFKGEDPADNRDFMVNQQISYSPSGNIWAPYGTTFYWPKSGSLDFICYSPYSPGGVPSVSENTISYSVWDVGANPGVDLLYADKLTGLQQNSYTYYYNGVPVLFRHALSRVSFSLQLAYSEVTSPTGDKTKWDVTVNSITLKDLRTEGSLDLTLESGLWKLPDNRVWAPTSASGNMSLDCSALGKFTSTDKQAVGEPMLVLPQALNLGQKLVINMTINTWRDTGSGYGTTPLITEAEVEVEAPLSGTSLTGWGINQSIQYNLVLSPSLVDADLKPTQITFDPAVAGWESVTVNAEIKI